MITVIQKRVGKAPEVKEIEPTLDNLKALIGGGHLEFVWLGPGVGFYCDEEGKLKHLPANFHTTADTICGDVVFIGGPDAEGNDTSVPEQFIPILMAYFEGAANA